MRETSPALMREERDQPGVVDLCSSAGASFRCSSAGASLRTASDPTMLPAGVVVGRVGMRSAPTGLQRERDQPGVVDLCSWLAAMQKDQQ
jgi:hypothetical protein